MVSIAKRLSSFFFLVWRFSYLERGWENHPRMCLTRGARVRNEVPWPLFATLWLRLVVYVPLAVWPDRCCFCLIFVREQRVPTAKRMSVFLFFKGTFSLLKEVERVKGEAESALERFEKMKKKYD